MISQQPTGAVLSLGDDLYAGAVDARYLVHAWHRDGGAHGLQ